MHVKPFAAAPGKGMTVHDQTRSCVRWFRWRTFYAFIFNCESIKSQNSTVITLRMSIINVLCQLYEKMLIVKIVTFQCSYGKQLKSQSFLDICLQELLCFDEQNSHYKSVPAF